MGLEHVPQKRIESFSEKAYFERELVLTSLCEVGQGTSMEERAPVTWRQEVQWQATAWRGREERGRGAVKVWALQRHCAFSSMVSPGLEAIFKMLSRVKGIEISCEEKGGYVDINGWA